MPRLKNNLLKAVIAPLISVPLFFSSAVSYSQDAQLVQMTKRNASGFAIDGSSNNTNGQDVYLGSENERNANQLWREIDRGDGYFSYQKINSDHCLDGGRGGANLQNVYLWSCGSDNYNQHWKKVDVGGGYYQLVKRNASDYALDGNRGGAEGQSIFLWDANTNNRNQHWRFNYVNDEPVNQEPVNPDPVAADCLAIDTLRELSNQLNASNRCVRMVPGTYTFDTNNVGEGRRFSDPYILQFTGSNNRFIFDGVTFNFDTNIFQQFGRESVTEFHVLGRNNVFQNLTMVDTGDVAPFQTALGVLMDGSDNLVDGFSITTRGSYPYGYGDIFGKGRDRILNHRKHSGVLIRGDGNHLRGLDLDMNTYGHGVFVQGGDDVTIEDVYVEGELSTVSAVLAEDGSGSPADSVDFLTVWGYHLDELTQDYRFSLQEDGIRAYSSGNIYGTDDSRATGSVTIKNSTVKFMRSGVTIGWARGEKFVENTTTLGNEVGYWVGSDARVVNSRGDSSVGPLFADDVYRSDSTLELTLLPHAVRKIGNTPSLYFVGDGHNLTLKDGTDSVISGVTIQVGGTRNGHRWLAGSGQEPPAFNADNLILDNQTPYRVNVNENSVSATVRSCGPVRNSGVNTSVRGSNNCN